LFEVSFLQENHSEVIWYLVDLSCCVVFNLAAIAYFVFVYLSEKSFSDLNLLIWIIHAVLLFINVFNFKMILKTYSCIKKADSERGVNKFVDFNSKPIAASMNMYQESPRVKSEVTAAPEIAVYEPLKTEDDNVYEPIRDRLDNIYQQRRENSYDFAGKF
jgi:hypothetical protein